MISIVITAFKEPRTIGKAIEHFLKQDIGEEFEIIVSAPDEETLGVARTFQKRHNNIRMFKDPGKGKSWALNILFKKMRPSNI